MPILENTDTLRITRRFKADRERVFAAFSSFEAMASWFGPAGCKVVGGSVDFRVGGQYRLHASTPDGALIAAGTYREITPVTKLVFSWKWEDDEDWVDLDSVVTLEFHAHGAETELQLTQVGFPNAASRTGHEHGWDGAFNQLEAVLVA